MVKIWTLLFAAAVLNHTLAIPSHAQSQASPAAVESTTLVDISLAELEGMLTSAQFRIVAPLENGLVVSSPSAVAPSGIFLWECNSGRCAGVRIESRFPVGDRHAAHQAIHSFDRSVPIAKVSFTEEQQGTFLHIGRDVWLAPGRSAENLLLQVRHVEKLTNSMIQHLLSRDPGIRDYWQSLTENRE